MASSKSTLAFFGATGGCTNSALILALQANHHCTALARTPSKLTAQLTAAGISSSILSTSLTIVQGDIKDPSAVKKALLLSNVLVDTIIFGIGMPPSTIKFTPNPLKPTFTEPTICQDGIRTVLTALKQILASNRTQDGLLAGSKRPVLVVMSTTGISKGVRDLPIAMIPLYHWMLAVPHADKRIMEEEVVATSTSADNPLRGFIVTRASFLTDGARLGPAKVRVGVEGPNGEVLGNGKGPAVGYTISRQDVGGWIFEQVIEKGGEEWFGKMVTMTY